MKFPGLSMLTSPLIKWLNKSKESREFPLSNFERIRYEVKPCDVLLVEGRTRVSEVIKLLTQSSWSHAALYLGRLHDIEDVSIRDIVSQHFDGEPDTQLIIESQLGLGTVVRPLSVYELDHLRICRPKGLSFGDSQEVIHYAVSRLGIDYDVRHIFDLARFLFPWWILPRKWRSTLFESHPSQSTKTVCSTMIAEAFNFIQFPILPLVKKSDNDRIQLFRCNPKLCTPSHFDYSPYFEIIKYPFMDGEHAGYRLLPWQGDSQLSPEERQMYMPAPEKKTKKVEIVDMPESDDLLKTIQDISPEQKPN